MLKRLAIAVIAALAVGGAFAQTNKIEGLPIKLGDSIEAVKAALGTTLEPEESQSAVRRNTKSLRLKTRGIWVFFDQNGRSYNIRLDSPFPGTIAGVKIGDSRARLEERLGKPHKVLKQLAPTLVKPEPYLYYIDDVTTVRFDFDPDGEIETAFILK
jgi:hypothetical protein